MPLGLGAGLSKSGIVTPGIVTDNLVLKHKYDAGAVVPVSDGAAYFGGAGTNDKIAITQISLSVHDAAFTFAFWAKRNTVGSAHHTILGRSTSSSYSHIRLSSDNYLKFESNTNTDSATITLNTVDTNWHHYVVIANSGTVTAYQDGVTCSVSGDVNGDDLTLNEIGSADSGGGDADNEMDGYICNLAYWSAVLTQPQIKSIMNKNYAGLTDSEKTNLVSWWNLDSVPASGNAVHNSSLVGALQYEDGASDIGYGAHASVVNFVLANNIELGADIFGGEGSFTTDTGYWTLSNDTKIENGLVITDTASYNAIIKNGILTDGKIYKLSFDVIDFTNEGNTRLNFNWAQSSTGDAYPPVWKAVDGNGSFYCYFEPGGSTAANFILYVSDLVDGYGMMKIDNIVCQEVTNAGVLK